MAATSSRPGRGGEAGGGGRLAVALTYWNMAPDELRAWSEADEGSIGHGGEWETSLQLYLRPELVDMSRAVKDEWRLKFGPDVGRYAKFPERRREMAHG